VRRRAHSAASESWKADIIPPVPIPSLPLKSYRRPLRRSTCGPSTRVPSFPGSPRPPCRTVQPKVIQRDGAVHPSPGSGQGRRREHVAVRPSLLGSVPGGRTCGEVKKAGLRVRVRVSVRVGWAGPPCRLVGLGVGARMGRTATEAGGDWYSRVCYCTHRLLLGELAVHLLIHLFLLHYFVSFC
jgi:hypothetical protein